MPQRVINSSNIDTLIVALVFDLYNKKIDVSSAATTYNDASGTGQLFVQGIDVKIEDQDGVVLRDYDWNDPLIKPQDGESTAEIDLSSMSLAFLFQTYKITCAIKDGDGVIYYTNPVFKKICQPVGMTELGYVPGLFQIDANCVDNILTVKELTLLVYNNQTPDSVTKSGTLSYPTGTISAVTFTGTPFTNNEIYTGQYRINCTTAAIYSLEDEVYVKVTYLTNNPFNITCASKMSDVICCLVDLQKTAISQCNNAIGKNAQQKLVEATMPFLIGLTKEINGQDSSGEAAILIKLLKCNCGATSLQQNEFTPINPAVTSIVITGVGGTTVPAATTNGNTKTYQIASNVYQVAKGNTGDLAFTISIDTSTQYVVKYKITFNYTIMAGYILDAIGNSDELTAQLNDLITNSGLDLSGIDGKCVVNLSLCDYTLAKQIYLKDLVAKIVVNGIDYIAPAGLDFVTVANIQTWLNSLGVGTWIAQYDAGLATFYSFNNTNFVTTIHFTDENGNNPYAYSFNSTCQGLASILQAIINFLCELTALQIALGRNLSLCYFDYNGNVVQQDIPSGSKQDDYNVAVQNVICNIVERIDTLTGITCAKMVALFTDSESSTFSSVARAYGNDGDNCVGWTPRQIALGIIAAIQADAEVKAAFCAIDCEAPATCPSPSDINMAMVNQDIGIYGVSWATATQATQTLTLQYKLSSNSTWLTASNALGVFANGNLTGTTPFLISGLVAGSTYDVRVVNNCGGTSFTKQITVPTGTVYSGSFLLDSSIYNICGNSPVTLYSAAPFGVGVIMYTDAGLTTPVTGYDWIADNNTGDIYNIDTATGEVGASTGSSCENGTQGSYLLGNDTVSICAATEVALYTNGAFAVGGTLYNDSGLTSPVTGYTYVVNTANNQIYNLNSSTGQIGAATGLSCTTYSFPGQVGNDIETVCSQPSATYYSNGVPAPGTILYTDVAKTIPVTGYLYFVLSGSAIFQLNTITGAIVVYTGNACP